MKRLTVFLIVLVAIGVSAGAYYRSRRAPEPQVQTMPITRGDVVDTVGATGTLQAVETVDVGTQVSGTVQTLYADFNSIVKKGQVIARLDPSLIQTQIEQQAANVTKSEADLQRLKVALADAQQKYDRAKELSARNLIPRTELETAEVNVKSADAQIKSAQATLVQARASLNNQKVNLDHTIITAPIDGIVISRSVDQGQTVAASMNAPTLFVLAADLTKMEVVANIDEADVGRMRPGQNVRFRVDAYPTEEFHGTVQQVRLQPTVVQNVVTYSTVIAVPNPELKLKPGMTANVNIEIAHQANVLRIPNAALRFRPTEEMFQVLNQPVPQELLRGRGGFANANARAQGGNRGGQTQPSTSAAPASGSSPTSAPGRPVSATGGPPPSNTPTQTNAAAQPSSTGATPGSAPSNAPQGQSSNQQSGSNSTTTEGRGGGDQAEGGAPRSVGTQIGGRGGFDPNMTPEERRKRMEERLAQMSPEERERWMARMRERQQGQGGGADAQQPNAGSRGGNRPAANAPGGTPNAANNTALPAHKRGATTIDALFGPLPTVESRGRAWMFMNKQLKPLNLRLGITDGTYTQVLSGEVQEGQEVVTTFTTGLEPKTPTTQQGGAQNPLMGPQRGRGGPGGFGGGGRGGR